MNDPSLLKIWLERVLLTQFPAVLACLVGCLWVVSRWRQIPADARWALPGFGLLLALTLSEPIIPILSQRWIMSHYESMKVADSLLTKFAFLWSSLHALAYAFLAVAALRGRSQLTPASPFLPADDTPLS